MKNDGVGTEGCRKTVTLCMTARRNIFSEDRLQLQGYGLWLIGRLQIVRLQSILRISINQLHMSLHKYGHYSGKSS